MEERKEIQLMDPLYEPVIMYPIGRLPFCKSCLVEYRANYMKFKIKHNEEEISSDHYQKTFRDYVRKKVKGELETKLKEYPLVLEKIDFNRSLRRQLRMGLFERLQDEMSNNLVDEKMSIPKIAEKIKPLGKEEIQKSLERESKEINRCINYKYEEDRVCENPLRLKGEGYKYSFNPDTALKELYDLYNELINTVEMQRLMHLQMTGFLSFKYPSSTHTRFAHVIGTWISGLVALQNVTVVTEVGEKRLIEFLADEDMHREFMAALILHDIGHAPFSHVLEMNPHLKYNHEERTEKLIKGGHSSNSLELEDLLVSSYVDLEYGFDEIYGIYPRILEDYCTKIRSKEKFVMVHDVVESMGLNEDIITELFSDEYSKDPAVRVLKGLVHGVIDIDRIDHIYRDLHYNSFKTMGIPLTSLLHGLTIHYGDALREEKVPWITISEEITPIVETLLAARELSNKAIFDNPVNNFYIGVLNSAISDAVIMMPLLKYYISYLTDEALLHVLMNKDLFHNLSPTEKIGIVTGSSFGHQDYRYSIYRIRDESEEIPDKKFKKDVLECISEVAMEHDVMWYAFLKDVRRDYDCEAKQCLDPEELGIEKLNEDKGKYKWFLTSFLLPRVEETEREKIIEKIKEVLENAQDNVLVNHLTEKIKKKTGKNGVDGLKKLYEDAKDGKDLKEEIKDLIKEEATSIFLKGLSTKVYIGEKNSKNKLEEKLKKYIEGITWDGNDKRSWTFTLFAKENDENDEVESEIKKGIIWIIKEKRLISPIFENNGEINKKLEVTNEDIAFIFFDNTEKDERGRMEELRNAKIKNVASQLGLHVFVIEKIVDKERV